jgi:hypothetical protein
MASMENDDDGEARSDSASGPQERRRRPALDRSAPRRDWESLATPSGERQPGNADALGPGITEAIARSVEAGYRVVDEYLRAGESLARSIGQFYVGGRSGPAEAGATDPGRLLGAAIPLWAEFVGGILTAGQQPDRPPRPRDGEGWRAAALASEAATPTPRVPADAATKTPGPEAPAVDISSISLRAAPGGSCSTAIQLSAPTAASPLTAGELICISGEGPPISGVAVLSHPAGIVSVAVVVPQTQPPGVYAGAVFAPTLAAVAATITLIVADT